MSVLVFQVVEPCELAGRYDPFGGTYSFDPEDGGSMF
jgi:hypothetical protein